MPINLREDGNEDFNAQASMTVVASGTQWAAPRKRLQAIMTSTIKTARSELKEVIPADFPSLLAPWLVGGAAKSAFNRMPRTTPGWPACRCPAGGNIAPKQKRLLV